MSTPPPPRLSAPTPTFQLRFQISGRALLRRNTVFPAQLNPELIFLTVQHFINLHRAIYIMLKTLWDHLVFFSFVLGFVTGKGNWNHRSTNQMHLFCSTKTDAFLYSEVHANLKYFRA